MRTEQGNQKELHDLIHCAAGLALAASALLILFGIFLTPAVLRLMNTPEDIMDLAVVYIKFIFSVCSPWFFLQYRFRNLKSLRKFASPMNYQLLGGIANVAGKRVLPVRAAHGRWKEWRWPPWYRR